mmetsp:Transcript_42363/g.99480  ORF Transcript_42363/g.99480 Transcript_42363/m.99480 type:complete len:218 (+) Transcript_42363:1395-2048(+)
MPGPGLHARDRDLGRPHLEVGGLGRGGRVAPVVGEQRDDLLLREVLLVLVPLEEAVPVVELHVRFRDPRDDLAVAHPAACVAHAAVALELVVDGAQPRHAGAPASSRGVRGRRNDTAHGRHGEQIAVEVSALLDVEEDHGVDARLIDLALGELRDLEVPHDAERREDDAEREQQHAAAQHGVAEDEPAGVVVRAGFAVVRDEEVQVVGHVLAVEGRD